MEHNLTVSNQGINAYKNFKTIFNTNMLLRNYLIVSSNAWMVQIKMIKGEKINITELIALLKVGVWRRSSEILFTVPLILLSFISRNHASNIFKKLLKKFQSFPAT